MNLDLKEDDLYYYDAKAAERPIKFIERNLFHYEDVYAGKPFILAPWQKQFVGDLFGWKLRATGRRRFQTAYMEIGKGSGKSPLLAALGLYMLVADNEEGPQVLSVATNFQQANITFDAAKKFIDHSSVMTERLKVNQMTITYAAKNGSWKIISGTPKGKHGLRPTCILADEIHEWPGNSHELHAALSYNMDKRSQPLFLMATNAGTDKESLCWKMHDKAIRVLNGESKDPGFYPCVYAASDNDDPASGDTWRKAIPSLGITISEDKLRAKWEAAVGSPSDENDFKRLYLSLWRQGGNKWLNMEYYDACVKPFSPLELKEYPSVLALDMSLNDDLSALAQVWVVGDKMYARVKHWIPKKTAYKYQDRDAIPFSQWAADKHISLLDTDTVDSAARRRIAKYINKLIERYKIDAVCYDPRYATEVIQKIDEKYPGKTVAVHQNFLGLSAACFELERRLKDGSIILPENPCLRWQAANVEVKSNDYGEIRPVKESAKGQYAGRRGCKIDGIVAIISALSRAMRHDAQESEFWQGGVYLST